MALADARNDSREVALRVVEQWRAAGANVMPMPPRFVFDDESVVIPVSPALGADGTPVPSGGTCTHVALVGPRGLSFRAKLSDASSDPLAPEPAARATSVAGVLELIRCDGSKPVRNFVITSDAGRGTIEMVVAQSRPDLPALATIIPERTGGALPPPPEAGALPPLATPEKRAEAAETRAKREGAGTVTRSVFHAADDGSGEEEVSLAPGCHRVELFAKDPRTDNPARRFRLDVDAEIRDADGDKLLARDRTEAPDARLEACVGRQTRATVVFVGAVPKSDVTATVASWSLPNRLPALWGPIARGKMARAMFTRHIAIPSEDPVFTAQGTSGTTPLPLPVEVGACYVAVVATTHGHPRTLQLRALVGPHDSTDERGAAEETALTSFCVGPKETARIEVTARPSGIGWGLAVYRVKSGVWEAGR
ncbi:hypothetical protein AKJ09_09064 [Labilithrix luteola]|uniref:Uncharacterized protein n=1 Tax=Labilithrix luteola TaxID=1391654 RepID=A0A0K1Q9D0_9BACT|nr:hypothetical protein [Labilithrix luteola]AKV02401.1 hypothetical protein AKJ09_09064 [Labilithrix luteola]